MHRRYMALIYLGLVVLLQVLPVIVSAEEPGTREKAAVAPSVMAAEKSGPRARVAILPFENLSGCFLVIDDVVRPFYQNLGKIYSLSSYEEVDEVILRLRLRHTGFLSSQEASQIGQRLGVEAIILGMICVYQETPEPGIGLIVKMIGTGEGTPILWMKSAIRSAGQGETWFGRNRLSKTAHLIDGIIKDLVKEMPVNLLKEDDE